MNIVSLLHDFWEKENPFYSCIAAINNTKKANKQMMNFIELNY